MSGRILIAGAGIGGLTTGLCLAKLGHEVTILERSKRLETIGAGIQISPNASRVLVALGLGPALERIAVPARHLVIRQLASGTPIARAALDELSRRFSSPYWLLHRADLQSALLEAAMRDPRISIAYDRAVETVEQASGGLSVGDIAGDGRQTQTEADLLVGANGLWSSLARDDNATKPNFTGYEAWRTLLPSEQVPQALRGSDVALWLGAGTHVVHYPVANGSLMNIVLVRGNATSELGWTRDGDPAALGGLIAAAAPELRPMLERVGNWQVWSLFDAPARAMAHGRIALVGDAAHPVLPFLAQGAALAIEDAALLASRLTYAVLADEAALKRNLLRYDRERRPRAANVQRAARRNGRAYHLGWPASIMRDQVMSLLGGSGLLRRYDWLYGWEHPSS